MLKALIGGSITAVPGSIRKEGGGGVDVEFGRDLTYGVVWLVVTISKYQSHGKSISALFSVSSGKKNVRGFSGNSSDKGYLRDLYVIFKPIARAGT